MTRSLFKWRQLLPLLFTLIITSASSATSRPEVFVDKGPDVQSLPFDFIYMSPPFQTSTNGVFQFGNALTIIGYPQGSSFLPAGPKYPVEFYVYDGVNSVGTMDFRFHGQAGITGMWIDNYPSGGGEVIVLFGQGDNWLGAVEIDQNVSINPATDYNGHAWFVKFNAPNIDHVQVQGQTDIDGFSTQTKGLP